MTRNHFARTFAIWNAEVRRARADYYEHPIISAALCELCGKHSRAAVCVRCADTYPNLAETRRRLLADMRGAA